MFFTGRVSDLGREIYRSQMEQAIDKERLRIAIASQNGSHFRH
jgi:hypothetical protein